MSAAGLRVLRVIGGLDPALGGPPQSAVAACLATQREGVRNTFLFATDEGGRQEAQGLIGRLETAGVEVLAFRVAPSAAASARRWGISPALVRWLRSHARHDAVHVHGALGLATTAALLTGVARRIPVVVSPHESLTQYDIDQSRTRVHALLKGAVRQLYRQTAALFVFASKLEAEGTLAGDAEGDHAAVVPHPVYEAGRKANAPRQPRPDSVLVGFLGRLHPKKNVALLIEALAHLPRTARVVVAGDGPATERERLQNVAAATDVVDRVEWRGWLDADARERFLEEVDIVAVPSAYECFGMAGAEALAHGLPVVVSPTTGIAEIVERRGCGIVAPSDPGALARAIATLATDPATYVESSEKALEAAAEELSYSSYGSTLAAQYRQLVSGATADSAAPQEKRWSRR
jgi:glycosyltransferase involved in cell wall biosynthesis